MALKLSRGPQVDVERCQRIAGGNRYEMIAMAAAHARRLAKENTVDADPLPSAVTALLDVQQRGIDPGVPKRYK
jgi:DNA-directed RNA polymerase subunit K/omega